MKPFDYENYYKNRTNSYAELVKETGKRKASHLKKFIQNKKNRNIIAEVGSGPGDVLNAFDEFRIKIGMDISVISIQQHINNYFNEKIKAKEDDLNFRTFYEKRISRKEIIEGFKSRPVYSDKNLFLIHIEPDKSLPFENNSIDCVVLCDVVEHVEQPIEFLKEAARISDYLLLKFPVERAFLFLLMSRIRGIEYGVNHPSGHLHCWSEKEIFSLLDRSNIEISDYDFQASKFEDSENKYFIKKMAFRLCDLADFVFPKNTHYLTKLLLGGSLYICAKGK